MEINLAKPNAETVTEKVVDVEVIPAGGEVATTNAAPLPVEKASAPAFDDENIGFDDVILPRINLVQKVGELSNVFTPGEIVLNQELVVHEPKTEKREGTAPLVFTVLGFRRKQFVERVLGGALGHLANTEQEVVAAGGTLDYNEAKASEATAKPLKLYYRLATALLLVEKPESVKDDVSFTYEFNGKRYALAVWSMKGTAYTNGAKKIFTARRIGHLRPGYPTYSWTLTTKLSKFGENYAYIPVLGTGAKHGEEFANFIKEVLTVGQ